MRTFKTILVVIAILIIIPLILALFVQKDYAVEREVTINKPVYEVFDYVRYLQNQDAYSKWGGMDPDMKQSYHGEDGSPGAISTWESEDKNVGKGEQEIIAIRENERIDYELRFMEPFQSTSQAYLITEGISENQTLVKWGFQGNMQYPMNLMFLFMDFETMIGDDLQFGLENLKTIMEE